MTRDHDKTYIIIISIIEDYIPINLSPVIIWNCERKVITHDCKKLSSLISAKKQTSKLITFCFALTLNGWICYCTSVRSASRRTYFEIIQLMIFWIQKTEGSCGRGFLKLFIYEYASVAFRLFLEFFFFLIYETGCVYNFMTFASNLQIIIIITVNLLYIESNLLRHLFLWKEV